MQKGFSLFEVLLTLAIIGFASLAIVHFSLTDLSSANKLLKNTLKQQLALNQQFARMAKDVKGQQRNALLRQQLLTPAKR